MRRILLWLGAIVLTWACTEDLAAPAMCPAYCPGYANTVVDTILRTNVARDSAFRGYVRPQEAVALPVVAVPAVESRALIRTAGIPDGYLFGTDPTPYQITGVDSVRVEFLVVRPDTTPRNLTLGIYRVSKTIDSTTTFADVAGSFVVDSLVRRVNFDSLLAQPVTYDSLLADSVRIDAATGDLLQVDPARNLLFVRLRLDSADAPYVSADSGRLGLGFAVSADSLPRAIVGSSEGGTAASVTWYLQIDSAGVSVVPQQRTVSPTFDSFVLNPPSDAPDSTLVVGGAPSARSLLRLDLPRAIRDSSQMIRATLVLVPDGAVRGVPRDSFLLAAYRVQTDLGAKSPLGVPTSTGDSSHVAFTWLHPGSTDTVRLEVTRILRYWASDTTKATTFLLTEFAQVDRLAEGASVDEVRFFPSSAAAWRPALHLTYVPRIHLGLP